MTEKLTFLQNLAVIFIILEFIKIFLCKITWKSIQFEWFSKNKIENVIINPYINNKNYTIKFLEYICLGCNMILCFSQWWWIGLSIFGLSLLTATILFPLIKDNEPFSLKIFFILFIDFALTILLLCQVVNPLKLIN